MGERVERRLAAILAADVVGYSRLVSADEAGALTHLGKLRRDIIEPNIASHSGRLFKAMGDGFLAEFASAVQATSCAVAIQRETEAASSGFEEGKKMRLRIGIHVGDVVVEGDDLMGDGVNIAARLESVAVPGGISISRAVHDQVRDRIDTVFDDKGEIALKNITRPVQVFAFAGANSVLVKTTPPALVLPDKPSIAVLPFQNMSGDPEQEYFADGMVEEIITALSRFKSLFVIARNSSFTYKGKAVDIKQVGRELGVRYVLEGSVRKAGNRLRITGQLIDAATGAHLWADKFEGELLDVFDLQDNVAMSVVGAIAPRLLAADAELARRKSPENWDSYDFYLRGVALFVQRNPGTADQSLELLQKAISLNPEFALAYIRAAACLLMRPAHGGRSLSQEERSEALRLTNCALALDDENEWILGWAGMIFVLLNGEVDRGSDLIERVLVNNPNFANAWNARGFISLIRGDGARALESFDHSTRLNPVDDWSAVNAMQGKMSALWVLGRYSDALEFADRLLARRPNDIRGLFMVFSTDPDPTRAAKAGDRIRTLYPHLRSSDLRQLFFFQSPRHRAMVEEIIARLGFPD